MNVTRFELGGHDENWRGGQIADHRAVQGTKYHPE